VIICLEWSANDLHIVQQIPMITFLMEDRCQRIFELKKRSSILALWSWKKLLIEFQEK